MPRAPAVRFKIEPAYATAEKIARLLCLTPGEFQAAQARLYARGFPVPDETTGRYDIEAVERWRKRQRPDLYPELTLPPPAVEDPAPKTDWGARFAKAQERRRNG